MKDAKQKNDLAPHANATAGKASLQKKVYPENTMGSQIESSPRVLQQKQLINTLSAQPVAQLKTVANYNTGTFKYRSNDLVSGFDKTETVGTQMNAFLDPGDPQTGSVPGKDQDDMMKRLNSKYSGPKVKGHLLNDHLGGPGVAANLFPITKTANSRHLFYVENYVKKAITEGLPVYYEVVVNSGLTEDSPDSTFTCKMNDEDGTKIFETQITSPITTGGGEGETLEAIDESFEGSAGRFYNSQLPDGWGNKNN